MTSVVCRPIIAALAISLVAAACSGDDSGADDGASGERDAASDDTAEPAASAPPAGPIEATVVVEPSPYSPIAAMVLVDIDRAARVRVTATAGDHVVDVPTTASAAASHEIPLVGMRQDLTYAIDVEVTDEAGLAAVVAPTFTTGVIDWPIPDFDVTVDPDRAQPGVTLIELSIQNPPEGLPPGQPVVGIDHEGEVVWWYKNTGTIGAVRPTDRGTLISQYFPLGVREIDPLGFVTASWQVAPEPIGEPVEIRDADALAAIDEVFGGNDGDPQGVAVRADWVDLTSVHHEAFPMPGGTILALATTNHEVTAEQRARWCPDDPGEWQVTSDVVVEFEPDGTVLRTWDLWDVLDIDEIPGRHLCETEGNPFVSVDFRDWTHANAVIYDPQRDAVIVSSRHTDQILALDHLDELGAQSSVRWILGRDATIALDGELPYHQHAIELQNDGSLLMNDNGNFRPGTGREPSDAPPFSRAVQYLVDDRADEPSAWSASQIWEHRMVDDVSGGPLFAPFLGDADRMPNGNVFITHGGLGDPDAFQYARLVEVVPAGAEGGEIVWDLQVGGPEQSFVVYRAERLPSLYFGPQWES